MDWTKLEKLDLGDLSPFVFFSELSGCTPNSKSLSFLFDGIGTPAIFEDNIETVRSFLGGIKRLESLDISILIGYVFEALLPVIQIHSSSLRVFKIHTFSMLVIPGWQQGQLEQVLEGFAKLSTLGIDLEPFWTPSADDTLKIDWVS